MISPSHRVDEGKRQLAQRRAELAQRFRRMGNVEVYLTSHTRLVDEMIQEQAATGLGPDLALFALAGYGRGRLYPQSDIDLLVVRQDPVQGDIALRVFFRQLWDSDLKLSQQVCRLADLDELEIADWEFLLALQDLRPLWGSRELVSEVHHRIQPLPYGVEVRPLLETVFESLRWRHRRFDDTIFHLEPDLKNGPGGLRDFHVLELARCLRKDPAPVEDSDLQEAQRSLGFMRICLHLITGRNQNRLTHRLQAEVACMFRPSPPPAHAVETVMEEYFRQARKIETRMRRMLRQGWIARDSQDPAHEVPGFTNFHQLLNSLLEVLRQERSLDPERLDAIHQNVARLARGIIHPLLAEGVLELFRPRPGLFKVLREFHDAGLLVVLFPEFESIQSRMVRDFYHRYTVDEHSLRAIRVSEELSGLEVGGDRRFSALLDEVKNPAVLTLSLLLHDVGKGQPGKHTETGARMAGRALNRFRFPLELVDDVTFLIRHHLAMSSLLQKRDLKDPVIVGQFADVVNTVERLRLLCLHTFCDISAVAPEAMTQWRRDRLWQLYVATYNKLTREYGAQRINQQDDHRNLLAGLPGDLDNSDFELFLAGFPRRYLSTSAAEIYRHFRLALAVSNQEPIQVHLTPHAGYHRLCVVTGDQRRLFARIAGLISYFELSIGRGHGFSNRAGLVLDIIEFSDPSCVLEREYRKGEGLLELLRASVLDESLVEKLLQRKEKSVFFRPLGPAFEPHLNFHDSSGEEYTIFELVAPDSLGLLYRIANEISELDCNIELVLIDTEGHRAIDVFYLTYRGKRLDDGRKGRLDKAIWKALSKGGEEK